MAWDDLTPKEKAAVKADAVACAVAVLLAIVLFIVGNVLNYRG